jgi:preprotein translocase subunit SecE
MSKLIEYIRDTKGELKHVSWPTRKQAIAFTVIVIAISLIVSIYLGLLDALFSEGLKLIVTK